MSTKYKTLRLYVAFSRRLQAQKTKLGVSVLVLGFVIVAYQNFLFDFKTANGAERKAAEIIRLAARGEVGKLSLFCDQKSLETLSSCRLHTPENINLHTTLNEDNAQIKAEIIAPDRVSLGRYLVLGFRYSNLGWQLVSVEDKGKKWQ